MAQARDICGEFIDKSTETQRNLLSVQLTESDLEIDQIGAEMEAMK